MKKAMSLLPILALVAIATPMHASAKVSDPVISCDSSSFQGYPEVQAIVNRDESATFVIGKSTNKPLVFFFEKVGLETDKYPDRVVMSYVGTSNDAHFKMAVTEKLGDISGGEQFRMVLTIASEKIAGTYLSTPLKCDVKIEK